ncbi:hypothetical protein KR084_000779, partial [Drosophila pseudotakahashii]
IHLEKMIQLACILLVVTLPWSESTSDAYDVCTMREEKPIKEIPWLASVRTNNRHICIGSIINPKSILITSRCLVERNRTAVWSHAMSTVTVRVGNANRDSGAGVAVCNITFHPRETKLYRDSGLAVLKLCQPLTYSAEVKEIAIVDKQPQKDAKASLSGWASLTRWGAKHKQCPVSAQQYDVQLIDGKACADERKQYFKFARLERTICSAKNSSSCSYDNGAPLVIDGKLAGILNIGSCNLKPHVYVNLFSLRNWIETNAND